MLEAIFKKVMESVNDRNSISQDDANHKKVGGMNKEKSDAGDEESTLEENTEDVIDDPGIDTSAVDNGFFTEDENNAQENNPEKQSDK